MVADQIKLRNRDFGLILFLLMAVNCSNADQKKVQPSTELHFAEIIEVCGISIYAALYHTDPSLFFNEPDTWQGYPVHTFHNSLPDTIKAEVFRNFSTHLFERQDIQSVNKLHSRLTKWCMSENIFQLLSEHKSIEEIIGKAYDSGYFEKSFITTPQRFHRLADEVGSTDAAATLSSAEIIQLYSLLIDELAKNRSIRVNANLDFIMID